MCSLVQATTCFLHETRRNKATNNDHQFICSLYLWLIVSSMTAKRQKKSENWQTKTPNIQFREKSSKLSQFNVLLNNQLGCRGILYWLSAESLTPWRSTISTDVRPSLLISLRPKWRLQTSLLSDEQSRTQRFSSLSHKTKAANPDRREARRGENLPLLIDSIKENDPNCCVD